MTSRKQTSVEDWLRAGPYTLALSSGFFGFYAHCGVVAALEERGLVPHAVQGSSAGGMIAGLWAIGLSSATIAREITGLERRDFWDPRPGLGLLRGQLFDERLRRILPHAHIEKCAVETRISVFDVRSARTEFMKEGDLALAIRASCALPVLFQPVTINGRAKLDGGIRDGAGLAAAGVTERVFHHDLLPQLTRMRPQSLGGRDRHRSVGVERLGAERLSLRIAGLPRVTPFALGRGQDAFVIARARMRQILAAPAPE